MKKFNLKKAKEGSKVITVSGKDVNVIYFERDSKNFPLVVLIENKKVEQYTLDGKLYTDKDSELDLKMK